MCTSVHPGYSMIMIPTSTQVWKLILFELSHIDFGANKRITVNLNGNPNPQELIDIDRVFRVKHVSNNSSLKRQEAEVGRKRNLKRDVFSQEADGSLPTGYLQVLKSLESQFSG